MQRLASRTASKQVAAIFLIAVSTFSIRAQESSPIPNAPLAQLGPPLVPPDLKQFSKPRSNFPHPLAPYFPRHLAPERLVNTPRIDQFLRDGKLYISIDDAVTLALENNLDLAIARINLKIADTDIWRADAGSAITGVNSGIVQNTPGGATAGLGGQVGSGEGGTTLGAGGAGAGAGGLVGSTLGSGAQISGFDPVLSGTVQIDHLNSECNTPLCATNQNTSTFDFTYTQGFHWGTDMEVDFNNSRVTSNTVDDFLSPALNSSFQFRLTQHLLQGFGFSANARYIQIARNNRRISAVAFRDQITATVNQIENMYWDLVSAYENVRVQKKQMEFAEMLLANNKRQMEIGALPSIEVVRAQSAIATDQQALTTAETNLQLAQLLMKNAITRSLDDPALADAEVIPTSSIELPASEPATPIQDLVKDAFSHRPDIQEAFINLDNSEISNKAIRNALLPTADLTAYYGGSGLGGRSNPAYICLSDPQICGVGVAPPSEPAISYGSTLEQLVNSSAPDKGITLNLTIPIRNRAAQATQVRSELEKQQSQILLQELENQIRIEVRNARFAVQQNRASVDAARAAVELAQQSLDLERKKFEDRASTTIAVLQNEAGLVQAEAILSGAKISYQRAAVSLQQVTGHLLDRAGISMEDAERGQVINLPRVPNAAVHSLDIPNPVQQ
jgi:outer membrane protein